MIIITIKKRFKLFNSYYYYQCYLINYPISNLRANCQQIDDKFNQNLAANWHQLCPQYARVLLANLADKT